MKFTKEEREAIAALAAEEKKDPIVEPPEGEAMITIMSTLKPFEQERQRRILAAVLILLGHEDIAYPLVNQGRPG